MVGAHPAAGAAGTKSPPTITGNHEQGRTLTVHAAPWTGEAKNFGYQWKRCENSGLNCHPINGANETAYVLAGVDVGKRIELKETASNAAGSQAVNSTATAQVVGVVPVLAGGPDDQRQRPARNHAARVPGKLEQRTDELQYRWTRCDGAGEHCEAITGATSKNYAPTGADVGKRLRVEEIARNATGAGSPATSAATAQVLPEAPAAISAPTITGTPQQGETLTANAGSWSNSPTGHSLQWLRCEADECVPIPGAPRAPNTRSPRPT